MRSVSRIILGIAKIHRAGEKLLAAVQPPRGQQFLGADDAQFRAEFRAENVLPAVAAIDRKISGAVMASAREEGDELRVLVVGMRRDVKHAAERVEIAQVLQNGRRRWRPGNLGGAGKAAQAARDGNHELDDMARERLGVRQPSGAIGDVRADGKHQRAGAVQNLSAFCSVHA